MPARRHNQVKRKRKRRPGPWKRRLNVYSAAGKQLWNDVKYLKSVINVEYKRRDRNLSNSVDNAGTMDALNLMAQGDTDVDRNGISIKCQSFKIKGWVAMHASATVNQIRLIAFVDHQPNGASPAVSDVLEATDVKSPYNTGRHGRFTFLFDKFITLDTYHPIVKFDEYVPLDMHTYFDGTTGSITDANKNVIQFLQLSTSTVNLPDVHYYSRVRYTDN